ncbi:hypothetical protein [Reyranella sp.]|uniref:hypothetical protein n=1 Tax=Reyranella sp. TaxID=1929291 RepID=UPI003BAA3104
MRGILAGVIVLAVAACGDQTQEFDTRLRDMAGSDERQLLGSMGRIPDNTYQLNAGTRILQWRWDTSYISPGVAPVFVGGWGWPYAGYGWSGPWMPLGGIPPTLVRQGCIVEWTVTDGATRSYRWQGSGCGSVTIHSSPPPG